MGFAHTSALNAAKRHMYIHSAKEMLVAHKSNKVLKFAPVLGASAGLQNAGAFRSHLACR